VTLSVAKGGVSGTLPSNLKETTTYYANYVSNNTFTLHTTSSASDKITFNGGELSNFASGVVMYTWQLNYDPIYQFGDDTKLLRQTHKGTPGTTAEALGTMVVINSPDSFIKDVYSDSGRDPYNQGYWWQEKINYTIKIAQGDVQLYGLVYQTYTKGQVLTQDNSMAVGTVATTVTGTAVTVTITYGTFTNTGGDTITVTQGSSDVEPANAAPGAPTKVVDIDKICGNPVKLKFEARYNAKLTTSDLTPIPSLNEDSNLEISSPETSPPERVIFKNTLNNNDVIYFDKLSGPPGTPTKIDSSTNMITSYVTTNKINGVPNLYGITGGTYNIKLNYILNNYSEHYGLDPSENFVEHEFVIHESAISNIVTNSSMTGITSIKISSSDKTHLGKARLVILTLKSSHNIQKIGDDTVTDNYEKRYIAFNGTDDTYQLFEESSSLVVGAISTASISPLKIIGNDTTGHPANTIILEIVEITGIEPRKWTSKDKCTREANNWKVENLELTNLSNNLGTTTLLSGQAEILTLKLKMQNTVGISNYDITNSVSTLHKFIHDTPSVEEFKNLLNGGGLKKAIQAHNNATSPDAPEAYDAIKNVIDNNQLNMWNGYFYSQKGWLNAVGSDIETNKTHYGLYGTDTMFQGADSDYKYVIFEYTYTTQNGVNPLGGFVVFGDKTNIKLEDFEDDTPDGDDPKARMYLFINGPGGGGAGGAGYEAGRDTAEKYYMWGGNPSSSPSPGSKMYYLNIGTFTSVTHLDVATNMYNIKLTPYEVSANRGLGRTKIGEDGVTEHMWATTMNPPNISQNDVGYGWSPNSGGVDNMDTRPNNLNRTMSFIFRTINTSSTVITYKVCLCIGLRNNTDIYVAKPDLYFTAGSQQTFKLK